MSRLAVVRQRRIDNRWLAIGASALVHAGLVWHGLQWTSMQRPAAFVPDHAITIRLLPADAPEHAPAEATPTPTPTQRVSSRAPAEPAPARRGASLPASPTQAQPADTPPAIVTPDGMQPGLAPPPPANTQDLLDRIAKGVLAQSRQTANQAEAARKPWDKASQPWAREQTGPTTNAQGQRSERVHSALGDYCVNSPNPATAYRSPNGLNIASSGNCP